MGCLKLWHPEICQLEQDLCFLVSNFMNHVYLFQMIEFEKKTEFVGKWRRKRKSVFLPLQLLISQSKTGDL